MENNNNRALEQNLQRLRSLCLLCPISPLALSSLAPDSLRSGSPPQNFPFFIYVCIYVYFLQSTLWGWLDKMWKLLKMPPASQAADGAASLCGKTRVDGLGWMPPLLFGGGCWVLGVGRWGVGSTQPEARRSGNGRCDGDRRQTTSEGRRTTNVGGQNTAATVFTPCPSLRLLLLLLLLLAGIFKKFPSLFSACTEKKVSL